jgi:hypothetical protein
MPLPSFRSAAAALLLAVVGAAAPSAGEAQSQYGQVIFHGRIMIRVTGGMNDAALSSPARPLRWKEKKGPKCISTRAIAGAALMGQNSVDIILRDRSRIRAKLESSCPALDYYHGFYVTPNEDGQICADRDLIRSRMGGECGIDKFRTLQPVRDD